MAKFGKSNQSNSFADLLGIAMGISSGKMNTTEDLIKTGTALGAMGAFDTDSDLDCDLDFDLNLDDDLDIDNDVMDNMIWLRKCGLKQTNRSKIFLVSIRTMNRIYIN